ncbi:MAG: amidase, partial [Pseudomonadota bacterium]
EDGALRSFIRVDADAARRAAAQADARRARGMTLGALDGVAFAVKDNLAVAGAAWTAGIAGRRGRIAVDTAVAVQRLLGAGAVPLGGLNMEEGALGAVTDNPTFGRCLNPLGEGLTPGGSSGGSAAAVAAGFVDLSLGTDTMGSVRIPAAYCGLYGLKPTAGLIPRAGLAYLSPTLDGIGPLARDAALIWPAVIALAGPDAGDPDARPAPRGWDVRPEISLRGVTLGRPSSLEDVALEPAVAEAFARACQAAEAAGARLVDVPMEGWDPGRARRGGLLLAEAEGAVALGDLREAEGALSPALSALLAYGAAASSARIVEALARLRAAAGAAHRALGRCDALILPTAPQRAFAHGAPIPADQADLTALANFAGLPAVALPAPAGDGGLPASVQLVGPAFGEARLTAWMEALARAL